MSTQKTTTTYDMLKTYLDDLGCFNSEVPEVVSAGVSCINTEAPYKMKLAISLSELVTFTTHLRKSIELKDGTIVPTNMIAFILGKSG